MATTIICPNCNTQFEPTEALAQTIREDMRKEFNARYAEEMKSKDAVYKQREQQIAQQQQQMAQQQELLKQQKDTQERELAVKLEAAKKGMEADLAQQINKRVQADFEHQLKVLEEANKANENKLTTAREKELDFLKKMQELQAKEQEIELEIQRKVLEERGKLSELVKKEEEERSKLRDTEYQMRMKEKDKQLEDQQRLLAEMQRKMEQGSMQLQGEVQELALEEMLKQAFPYDVVSEVGKGVRGADCVLTVRNNYGQECGRIIFESKRTKDFSEEWIEKLKSDMRSQGADVAVIVTQAMPKDMNGFGEKKGIWVCNFAEVKPLVYVLRELVIKVYNASKSQENKGDKMTLLYNYLVSNEFAEQWKAIREGFMNMKMSIQVERVQMEKLWKAREKQLEKVLLNAAHIRGSIEGISGMDVDLDLLGSGGETVALGEG